MQPSSRCLSVLAGFSRWPFAAFTRALRWGLFLACGLMQNLLARTVLAWLHERGAIL
jgi:hypothetical protein